jgi:predicted amidohydrolase YtcJ
VAPSATRRGVTTRPPLYGTEVLPRAAIERTAKLCLEKGYQLCVHAIGDAAVREVLSAYEAALGERRDARFRVEHASLIAPDDLPRFAKLGVIASIQPASAGSFAVGELGPERTKQLYPWARLLALGAHVTAGSDAPAWWRDPDPRAGLEKLVAREDGRDRLTPEAALRAYTEEPAYASSVERERGRLLPGMDADLTVLAKDPLELMKKDSKTLLDLEVVTTYVGGIATR